MPADFISSLFVFILSAFLGFEVIKRVSPLLHTPLMSLTNALDAIVVVAAIIIAGRHESRLSTILGLVAVAASFSNMVGGFVITDRMLHMFKSRQGEKAMTVFMTQQLIDSTYILAAVGFILALKWLSSPVTAMRGVLIGEIASALAVVATLFDPQVSQYKWILIALIIGAGSRRASWHGEDDRRPSANRDQPRVWRALGRADRHRGILRAPRPMCRSSRWRKSGSK